MTSSPSAMLVTSSAARAALLGFLVSGLFLAFPGAFLPAWDYHLRPNYTGIGNYFLAVNFGLLVAVRVTPFVLRRWGPGPAATGSCLIGSASLVGLSLTLPPVPDVWRLPGFAGLGFAAGALNTALFHAISSAYRLAPAATVNLAGLFFGLGCLTSASSFAATYGSYSRASVINLVALVPAIAALQFARLSFRAEPVGRQRSAREVAREFSVPSAVLLTMLLFFQFGNEWALAGWLPLFLIERLGFSPSRALWLLAAYWLALVIGRLIAQSLIERFSDPKLLMGSAGAALFGCVILSFTNNLFGALLGTLLVGIGFAPIYPLAVEKIGARFPHYHPGLFNGIFSIGLTGGMLAPACVGYASEFFGVRVLMAFPVAGTFVVFLLVILIWIDARWGPASAPRSKST